MKFKLVQQTFDVQAGPAGILVHMMSIRRPGSFSPQSTLRVGWFVDGVSRVFNLQWRERRRRVSFFRFLSTLMPSTGQIVLSRHRFSTGTTGSSTWFLFTHDARRVDEFLQWQSRSRFTNDTPTINLTRLKLRYKSQMAVY